jgi:cobalt-precorrin 5A hydrolase/precorrin-3B C17-methyltransferase
MTKILDGKIAIIYLSERGKNLAEKIIPFLPKSKIYTFNKEKLFEIWESHKALIFIMATGIVIRSIAFFITNKKNDPAVLVIDEKGKFIIPLLGGHQAGANELAKELAKFLNSTPVLTTASDLSELPALDLWIERCGFKIKNPSLLPKTISKFIDKRKLNLFIEKNIQIPLPEYFQITDNLLSADIIITNKSYQTDKLILVPQNLFVGIGFHEGITEEEIEKRIREVFSEKGFLFEAIKGVATLERKANYQALKEFCKKHGFKLYGYSSSELNQIKGISHSETVFNAVGVSSVCEQASLLASRGKLVIPKQVFKDMTIAVAECNYTIQGKLYVVGIGPGTLNLIAPSAIKALRNSDLIIGYKTYIEYIKPLVEDKEVLEYSMTDEVKRAKKAVEEVLKGKIVSLVSGGDPGVYGMAGLIFEILAKNKLHIEVEIIPGISALNACSAKVGAPLMNDFAVISLSDRLTPWEDIEKRLKMAGMGDFVIVIYNPKSMKRKNHLTKAKEIILKYRKEDTPVAIVKGATRENESIIVTTLKNMDKHPVDMQTTVIVGNSKTFIYNNLLITPRGYERKYEKEFKLNSPFVG